MTKAARKRTAKVRRDDAKTLHALLKGKDPAHFTESQLSFRAHRAWRRERFYDAFVLFDAAGARARADRDALSARNHANRAAITLFRSGVDAADARKRLREVVDYYAAHPGDIEDRHMVDHALTALLEDVAERGRGAAAFRKAYRAAVKEGTRLLRKDGPFPRSQVVRVMEAALRAGAHDVVAELIALRRARKPLPRKIRLRLENVERLISRPGSGAGAPYPALSLNPRRSSATDLRQRNG